MSGDATEAARQTATIPLGIAALDALLGGGLRAGSLTVIGSRPGNGKTALLATAVCHATTALRVPTLVFSLESGADVFAERLVCAAGRIPHLGLRTATLERDDVSRLTEASKRLAEAPLVIDERSADIEAIVEAARRWHADPIRFATPGAIGLVAIDYFQMIESRQPEAERYDELCRVSGLLRQLATRLGNVAIVASSQLSPECDARPGKLPLLSDLREAGTLQDDADVVLLAHRPRLAGAAGPVHDAQLIVAKQRGGATGTAPARFLTECTRFVD